MNNPHLLSITVKRHWMHIWKVGYCPCAECSQDSRYVTSFVNDDGDVVEQVMYCADHAPTETHPEKTGDHLETAIDELKLGLGTSFVVNYVSQTASEVIDEDEWPIAPI